MRHASKRGGVEGTGAVMGVLSTLEEGAWADGGEECYTCVSLSPCRYLCSVREGARRASCVWALPHHRLRGGLSQASVSSDARFNAPGS